MKEDKLCCIQNALSKKCLISEGFAVCRNPLLFGNDESKTAINKLRREMGAGGI